MAKEIGAYTLHVVEETHTKKKNHNEMKPVGNYWNNFYILILLMFVRSI